MKTPGTGRSHRAGEIPTRPVILSGARRAQSKDLYRAWRQLELVKHDPSRSVILKIQDLRRAQRQLELNAWAAF
ncbi:MAG: hypothetical protein AAF170_18585 [Bacteroidota bacterium]